MHSLKGWLPILLLAMFGTPLSAHAQPTHVGYRVSIPKGPLIFRPLGGTESAEDTVHLMWNYGPRRVNPDLTKGTTVTRTWTIEDDVKVTRAYTLTRDDSLEAKPSRARVYPGRKATIYLDEDEPSRLHVNFWLPSEPVPVEGDATGKNLTPEEVRDIDFYYELENRQTVRFPFSAISFGAITIPLQYRLPYTADNGREIEDDFGTGPTAALYGGYTWGSARYTYLKHAENEIERNRSFTLGTFVGVSTVTVDSASSLSAAEPLDGESTVGVASLGVTGLFSFRGVEAGLFLGVDFAGGSAGRKWDYDRRPWVGLGVGFNLWSLLGS
jgi:hypothetical protein